MKTDPIKWRLEDHRGKLPQNIVKGLTAKYKAIYQSLSPEAQKDILDYAEDLEDDLSLIREVIRQQFKNEQHNPADVVEILTLATYKPLEHIFTEEQE